MRQWKFLLWCSKTFFYYQTLASRSSFMLKCQVLERKSVIDPSFCTKGPRIHNQTKSCQFKKKSRIEYKDENVQICFSGISLYFSLFPYCWNAMSSFQHFTIIFKGVFYLFDINFPDVLIKSPFYVKLILIFNLMIVAAAWRNLRQG